jgi:hypothetical protein
LRLGLDHPGAMASTPADQLGVIDDSASEYVAERLSKIDVGEGGESESDLAIVGEGTQKAAGPGGAVKPGEAGAHPLTSPATPKLRSEAGPSAAAGEAVPETEDVEELLRRAGFIKQLGPYTYEIQKGALIL